jgi:hypothetical protein
MTSADALHVLLGIQVRPGHSLLSQSFEQSVRNFCLWDPVPRAAPEDIITAVAEVRRKNDGPRIEGGR